MLSLGSSGRRRQAQAAVPLILSLRDSVKEEIGKAIITTALLESLDTALARKKPFIDIHAGARLFNIAYAQLLWTVRLGFRKANVEDPEGNLLNHNKIVPYV